MQPDPYKFMRDTLAATDVTRTYRELIASMQMNLKAQDIATVSSGQAMRDAIALSSGQTMRDAIAAMDVTRSYETLLFSKNMSTSVFDQLAGLEVSRSYNQLIAGFDATKSVHDMLSRLDVARTYRELIAELDTVAPFRDTVAKIDIDSTYRHMFDAIDSGAVLRNFATGIDVAKVVCEAITALDQDPASPNAVQLGGADLDVTGAVVFDLFVPCSFDGPVAGAVAFDYPRIAAVSAFEPVVQDLGGDAEEGVSRLVRGESPRSHRLRGGSPSGS